VLVMCSNDTESGPSFRIIYIQEWPVVVYEL
jgi:hypothetical protein